MVIQSINLKRFRCFENMQFTLDAPIVLIKGKNGTGKTSLLEALYYASHLRSFRTHVPKELIKMGDEAFFLKLNVRTAQTYHELSIGFSSHKKSVKIDSERITSYKDLFSYVRMVSMGEDDLILINGSPDNRRSFIDQALMLEDPDLAKALGKYRQILANRNALIKKQTFPHEIYHIWTERLWEFTILIQKKRCILIDRLERKTNSLLKEFVPDCPTVRFNYQVKKGYPSLKELLNDNHLRLQEARLGRSLFGAHLDDIAIIFDNHASKPYASRGQQKLIILALKVAHIKDLQDHGKSVTAFLLDDFMADFDEQRMGKLLPLLVSLNIQLIFTCPTTMSPLESFLKGYNTKEVTL